MKQTTLLLLSLFQSCPYWLLTVLRLSRSTNHVWLRPSGSSFESGVLFCIPSLLGSPSLHTPAAVISLRYSEGHKAIIKQYTCLLVCTLLASVNPGPVVLGWRETELF